MAETTTGRVLVVDDDREMRSLLKEDLTRQGHAVLAAADGGQALALLQTSEVDAVLADLNMPGTGGLDLCARLQNQCPELPVVILTAFGSLDTAIAALRAGAYDFVTKPVDLDLLAHTVQRAVRHRQLEQTLHRLQDEVRRQRGPGALLGESGAMAEIRDLVARLAGLDSSVLISGESGTGKELVARALHEQSERHSGPFIAVNCAALPETLLESELFGHERGAFTDARNARRGLFLEASGGTLLLDEVGELPLPLQPKLLRVLEERKVRPVGGNREIDCDVRIIAATHRNLEEAIAAGTFREDLFYRLNVLPLDLPPLRARGNDILLLAQVFVDEFAERFRKAVKGLTEQAATRLLAHAWPGNVRELRNVIERAVALTRHERLTAEDLPERLRQLSPPSSRTGGPEPPGDLPSLAEMERRYLHQVLERVGDNRTLAASILGIDRKTLYRKLQEETPS
jgi:two-component system, NtrC family, response regulator AtoC